MDKPESKAQSFIVKLWLEEAGGVRGKAVWRGYITHVPGGERRYLRNLSDISDFIGRYMAEAAVKPGLRVRLRNSLRRWRLSRTKSL
jgi:hypothetical protein